MDLLTDDFIIQNLLKTHCLCYFSEIEDVKINIFEIQKVCPVAVLFLNAISVISI